ncbi:metalloregulator ArsR/SmtB family transcription factor [Desulfovibrio sp. OttesenSCG-928-C14]|nr:metalloregulator ArsR/SmtB family transcription factor [Desulfovibrio sp. OttesenSCG-928-C14]
MIDFINITKALTDENRLRVLMILRGRELCVCQLTAFLDLAPSTTSKHLSVLKQARLIDSSKHGKWVYYRLADGARGSSAVRAALALVTENLADNPVIQRDEVHLREVLQRENSIWSGQDMPERDCMHSLELHSLNPDDLDPEEAPQGEMNPDAKAQGKAD